MAFGFNERVNDYDILEVRTGGCYSEVTRAI